MTYNQEYHQKNKEKRKLNSKNWRAKNPVRVKETLKKWHKINPGYYKKKMETYRPKANESARKWRKINPDKAKDTYYRYQYGISLIEYRQIHDKQGGLCAICGNPERVNGRSLCVDHNHQTGEVRGLLCLDCNTGIGHFKDNKKYLASAIDYLESK